MCRLCCVGGGGCRRCRRWRRGGFGAFDGVWRGSRLSFWIGCLLVWCGVGVVWCGVGGGGDGRLTCVGLLASDRW